MNLLVSMGRPVETGAVEGTLKIVFLHVQKMLLKADFRPVKSLVSAGVSEMARFGKMARKSVLDSQTPHV